MDDAERAAGRSHTESTVKALVGSGCMLDPLTIAGMLANHRATLSPEGTPVADDTVERACEVMHDAYEAAAVTAGWETQQRSRVPWAGVPEANKATMRAAVTALLEHLDAERRADG